MLKESEGFEKNNEFGVVYKADFHREIEQIECILYRKRFIPRNGLMQLWRLANPKFAMWAA